jgi:GT2 family glycosyltransferase
MYRKIPEIDTEYIGGGFAINWSRILSFGVSEYVVLCNNDLTYEKGWASKIIEEMEKDPELLSASPFCPQVLHSSVQDEPLYYGYTVRQHIAGWCIFQKRDIYKKIPKLDEDFEFWYCDNDYAMELMSRDIKHALVTGSVVNHHDGNLGKTGNTAIDQSTRMYYTNEQSPKFSAKWSNYLKNK